MAFNSAFKGLITVCFDNAIELQASLFWH